ncbi:MAG: DUF2442 domain-containing protein [Candidatus Brachytrichaceae bacterium NZ_4S206]|jgi:hypothetical protein
MRTTSEQRGTNTSVSEVTSITAHGIWLWVDDHEYFVPFADYPALKKATVEQLLAVKRLSPTQLCWEALDVDIELDALEHPEHFPLQFKP